MCAVEVSVREWYLERMRMASTKVYLATVRPTSVGEITLASNDPFADPVIDPQYVSSPPTCVLKDSNSCPTSSFYLL